LFKNILFISFLSLILPITIPAEVGRIQKQIPLPEHPRPDFNRPNWINLNGNWQFRFDAKNLGKNEEWFEKNITYPETIMVPFPWGSSLSGVKDKADIAWYARWIKVPDSWKGKRVFLVIGACDWRTKAWLDGKLLGSHQGGYTPFEFELTSYLRSGKGHRLVLRVDDTPHPFKLEGKQGYGPAKGIWQTPYLEARGDAPLAWIHFSPDIDNEKVKVEAELMEAVPSDLKLRLDFTTSKLPQSEVKIPKAEKRVNFEVSIPKPRLWTLDDPFLYEVKATVSGNGIEEDQVNTYFGMRKISVIDLPGTDHPYIALNNKPIYLQMTLDQAYNPEGYYTFPSDKFTRDEILRSRRIGLNGMRIHVKVGIPRKLYWADRLGMLIMADVPNSWGEPTKEMRQESNYALVNMIRRDYNHPSIFYWVLFNETWGLRSKKEGYKPETQEWVISMFQLAKSLDPTRLVEDNSACDNDHVITDVNSWHAYLPGYSWQEVLDEIVKETYPGSKWNFIGGRKQERQPLLNSECGNVWGYKGSTGDVDWSWDYHIMMNKFRSHPKLVGWLYTEHHDVINEWNGYYRYDRSEKVTGLSKIVDGMSLNDLHSPFYIAPGGELCREVKPETAVKLPLWASFMTDNPGCGKELKLQIKLYGWNTMGHEKIYFQSSRKVHFEPWMSKALSPIEVPMPKETALTVLLLVLEDELGDILHRNFTTFLVANGESPRDQIQKVDNHKVRLVRFAPNTFYKADWTLKQWEVLNGLKVNGAGSGFFEYRIPWPKGLALEDIQEATFLVEVSAKQLFGKDREGSKRIGGDYMRGKGAHDPSLNQNSYPMTDMTRFPSAVRIRVGGKALGNYELKDDSADHRGILSWFSQKRDRRLHEAGSYGELLRVSIPKIVLREGKAKGGIIIRLEVDDALPGGLAIYGERFGRYPLDPTLAFMLKD